MMPTQKDSIRLFRFAGIQVFLHWSWFVAAIFLINYRKGDYVNITWNVLEYLGLFVMVLMHEFGHSLACRQTGGRADQIILFPLGGVAFVDPPQRPGATLWSLVAGPLVNVVLAPILGGLCILTESLHWPDTMPNAYLLLRNLFEIDIVLLVFNLMPVYPLDGGQILRSLLWFVLGRSKSLLIATVLGFIGVGGFILYALSRRDLWLGIMAAFLAMNCWKGFQYARTLSRISKLPRRANLVCPACKAAPPIGHYWQCGACQQPFDIFASAGNCPHCAALFNQGRCLDCGGTHPLNDWYSTAAPARL